MLFKMVTRLTKDSTIKLEEVKVQMEEKISVEEWNSATQVNDSLDFQCNVGESVNVHIQIYPKGCDPTGCDVCEECNKYGCDSVCVFVSLETPDDSLTCLLWAGRFQKQGSDNSPVNLHDDKTWKIRKGPRPSFEDNQYGGHVLKAADIPEHTIDGFLVFKAEIQVSFNQERYFDKNIEKHTFFNNLFKKFGDDDSDFTVKSSEGKIIPCHKIILSAHSEYFKTLLESGKGNEPAFKEKIINEVSFVDIDHSTMTLLLRYMYSLDIPSTVTKENVTELMMAADRLQMKELVQKCVSLLMDVARKSDHIQTFIIVDKIQPKGSARQDLLDMMRKDKKLVAASEDFPLFVEKYPSLAVEFMKAVCLDQSGI